MNLRLIASNGYNQYLWVHINRIILKQAVFSLQCYTLKVLLVLVGVRTEHCVSSALIGIQIGVETEHILSVVLRNNFIVCRPVLNQWGATKIRHLFAEKKEEKVARIKPTTS